MLLLIGIGIGLAGFGILWLSLGLQGGIGSDILLTIGGLSASMGLGLILIMAHYRDTESGAVIEDESYSEQDALAHVLRKLSEKR